VCREVRRRLSACLYVAAALAVGLIGPACGADALKYPAKLLRFIVPFAPGGNSDVHARLIGQKLTAWLGQQVIIDNRPGAAGTIGVDIAAKAPADGYIIVLASFGNILVGPSLYQRLPYDPVKDLALAGTPKAIITRLNQAVNRAFTAPESSPLMPPRASSQPVARPVILRNQSGMAWRNWVSWFANWASDSRNERRVTESVDSYPLVTPRDGRD